MFLFSMFIHSVAHPYHVW